MSTIRAIAQAARAWRDPHYAPRRAAVEKTLEADNRFTEQAIAFAINQQMRLINVAALERWLAGRAARTPRRVGVLEAGNVPLAGLQDYLAVVIAGHHLIGSTSSRSPWLLQAFAGDVQERGGPVSEFVSHADLIGRVDALIASGTDETVTRLAGLCGEAGIPQAHRLLRGNRFSIAVIDGGEHEDQRVRLAEDALLHEGLGCRNVAMIFAPKNLDADPYFEAFSVFRGTFPAHPATGGALKMQQAFLSAVGAPHAFGEGLVYLVSRGAAEVQPPGHIRWIPYESVDEVNRWIAANGESIQVVVARPAVQDTLTGLVEIVSPGQAQRPKLDWKPDGRNTLDFLVSLG